MIVLGMKILKKNVCILLLLCMYNISDENIK